MLHEPYSKSYMRILSTIYSNLKKQTWQCLWATRKHRHETILDTIVRSCGVTNIWWLAHDIMKVMLYTWQGWHWKGDWWTMPGRLSRIRPSQAGCPIDLKITYRAILLVWENIYIQYVQSSPWRLLLHTAFILLAALNKLSELCIHFCNLQCIEIDVILRDI